MTTLGYKGDETIGDARANARVVTSQIAVVCHACGAASHYPVRVVRSLTFFVCTTCGVRNDVKSLVSSLPPVLMAESTPEIRRRSEFPQA